MRVCCPSSRALPAAELAHGQAARKRRRAAWSEDPGAWVLRFLMGTRRLPPSPVERWAQVPSLHRSSLTHPLAPRSRQPGHSILGVTRPHSCRCH